MENRNGCSSICASENGTTEHEMALQTVGDRLRGSKRITLGGDKQAARLNNLLDEGA
jgi:hypothetical protein